MSVEMSNVVSSEEPQVTVVSEQQYEGGEYSGPHQSCMVEVCGKTAKLIYWINVFFPGYGTKLGACKNYKGCNWNAFCLGEAQTFTAICCIGWIWSIWWGGKILEHNKDRPAQK